MQFNSLYYAANNYGGGGSRSKRALCEAVRTIGDSSRGVGHVPLENFEI